VRGNYAHQPQENSIQCGIQSRLGSHGCKATNIFESRWNRKILHIVRMVANSQLQCFAIKFEGCKCEGKITKGSSCT
jgi:hypothetical protein